MRVASKCVYVCARALVLRLSNIPPPLNLGCNIYLKYISCISLFLRKRGGE